MTLNPEQRALQLRPPQERRNQPSIAIVVTSSCDVDALRACIASLGAQCAETGAKLIIAHTGPLPDLETLGADQVPLTIVTAPSGTTAAELRRVCAWRSAHNIIAFADDCAPEQIAWARDLCRAWQSWNETGGRLSPPMPEVALPTELAPQRPRLSVVVPVRDGAATLTRCLESIAASDLTRNLWELVVVDDGSSDSTPLLAAQFADRLVQLPDGPHGPGYTRNRGFEMTLGECVAFVNADVMVRPDTLRRFYEVLTQEPDVGAVFGSYDTEPAARNFVSQYRNLLQHYYHQRNAGEASTFWSACGAVRSYAFERAGCFDEWHFPRRQLEDLELGQRLRASGQRVLLLPDIQVTNLKRWTLRRIVTTEIFDRGVPWMRLMYKAVSPASSSHRLRALKRMNVALTSLAIVLAVLGLLTGVYALLGGAAACIGLVVIDDSAQLAFFRRERGMAFALKSIAIDLVYYCASGVAIVLGWIAQHTLGEPRPRVVTEAFAELNVKTWPPVPSKRPLEMSAPASVVEDIADDAPAPLRSEGAGASRVNFMVPPAIDIPPSAPLQ